MKQGRIMCSLKNESTDSLGYASKSFLSIHLILANGARNGLSARHGDPKPCDSIAFRFKQAFKPTIPVSGERLKTKAKAIPGEH